MATLRTVAGSPKARRSIGESVLAAAAVVDTKPVRAQLAAFAKAHQAYVRAAEKVLAAEAVRDAAHAALAEADVAQDSALDALVLALVVAGAARLRPLKGLSNLSPSDLKGLATLKEAKELQRVTAAIAKRAKPTPALRKATKAAADAAAAVVKASASVVPREKLYQESLAARDALSLGWETTVAYLKRAARVADDNGAKGLFAVLFERPAEASAKAKKKPGRVAAPRA